MSKSKHLFKLKQILEEHADMNYRRYNSMGQKVEEIDISKLLDEYGSLREIISYETIYKEIEDFLINKFIIENVKISGNYDLEIKVSGYEGDEDGLILNFLNINQVDMYENYSKLIKSEKNVDIILLDNFFQRNLKYINMCQYILQNLEFIIRDRFYCSIINESLIDNIKSVLFNKDFINECKKPVFELFECLENLI